jgi:hypothetical protein|tara:strand:- start:2983 stop:3192 length:210 start_codon:yes stop_codon:yes gene_type:complete
MGRTNRDQIRTRKNDSIVDDEYDEQTKRQDKKRMKKHSRRAVGKNLKDIATSGVYYEDYDEELYDDDYV